MAYYTIIDEQYETGLNVYDGVFAENGFNGFKFCSTEHIFKLLCYGSCVREVTLPIENENFKMVSGDKI